MNNKDAQNEEILALQSIYDSKYFTVDNLEPPCGSYSADVQLPDNFFVLMEKSSFCHMSSKRRDKAIAKEEFQVEFLPPINLYFEFPETYPSDSPPAFFISCSWLTYDQLTQICQHLDRLWKEGNGEVVLFQWIQFLKEECLDFLNVGNTLNITELSKYKLKNDEAYFKSSDVKESSDMCCSVNDSVPVKNSKNICMPSIKPSLSGGSGSRDRRAFLDIADGKILKNLLREFNEHKKSELFMDSWHPCSICFMSKQGSDFVTFRQCHHVFCKECIKSYFELMIKEGNVHSLNCPQDKCPTQAESSLVKQIVDAKYFERYDSLLLASSLQTMSDIAYCPRSVCQCPLLIDVCGRIGTCPACNFVFCPFCKMAYHGVAPCNFKSDMKKKICDEYLEGDETTKAELERRHGKRAIKSLVEDILSENWIGSNSKTCPNCQAAIEKTEGCNKMTCFKCGIFFCWLCKKRLNAANPYLHYSQIGSECYDRLFPPEALDEDYFWEPGAFLNY